MRHAIHALLRTPGFTAAAVVTLTVGIGASVALFSVGHAVLLKPLPYREANRLAVVLAEQDFEGAGRPVRVAFPTAAMNAWPASGNTFERVAFVSPGVAALHDGESSELIDVAVVSGSFFETTGGELILGRGLTPADDLQPAAVIAESLWRRLHGRRPDVLGREVRLNGRPYTIIGVARGTLQLPRAGTEAWLPAGLSHALNQACCSFTAILRADAEAAAPALRQEIIAIVDGLVGEVHRDLEGARVRIVGLREFVVGDTRQSILVLGSAVGMLFLLACANVMNLLLARATRRAHEMRIRRALGASRMRIVLQSLTESAVLSVTAGLAGVALAILAVRVLKSGAYSRLPRLDAIEIDGSVLAFAVAAATVAACAVALLPALRWTEGSIELGVRQPGAGQSRLGRSALRALTIAQVALSVVLLVGAALLGRSLAGLMETDIGISPQSVATASLNLAMNRTLTDQQQVELVERVLARIAAMPDVTAAGVGAARPPDTSRMRLTLRRGSDPNERASYQAAAVPATPGYFPALGVRLERGRFFTDADHRHAAPVVIVSATTASHLFGGEDPLGKTIALPVLRGRRTTREEMTVVGVTSDVRYSGLDRTADDLVYRPFAQQPWRAVFLMVRTTADPSGVAARLRSEVAAVDREVVVSQVTTLEDVLADVTATPRFRTVLLVALAALATLIATVGLYAVVAYSVSTRTQEMGIRMALGASGGQIRALVLREGTVLAAAGTALGLCAAFAAAQLLSGLLYGIAPSDPVSYGLAAITLLAVALAATTIPAARASKTDPAIALRAE